nr:hypothetical protein [Amycolatopsis sp. MtRt-6]
MTPPAHRIERRSVDQLPGFRRQGQAQDDEVAAGQQGLPAGTPDAQRVFLGPGERVAVVAEDVLGPERREQSCHGPAEPSHAGDPDPGSAQPGAVELGAPAGERSRTDEPVTAADVAHQADRQTYGEFRGRRRQHVGQDRQPHPPPRARGDVEVVEPLERGADDLELRAGREQRVVHPVRHGRDERVRPTGVSGDVGAGPDAAGFGGQHHRAELAEVFRDFRVYPMGHGHYGAVGHGGGFRRCRPVPVPRSA